LKPIIEYPLFAHPTKFYETENEEESDSEKFVPKYFIEEYKSRAFSINP